MMLFMTFGPFFLGLNFCVFKRLLRFLTWTGFWILILDMIRVHVEHRTFVFFLCGFGSRPAFGHRLLDAFRVHNRLLVLWFLREARRV